MTGEWLRPIFFKCLGRAVGGRHGGRKAALLLDGKTKANRKERCSWSIRREGGEIKG